MFGLLVHKIINEITVPLAIKIFEKIKIRNPEIEESKLDDDFYLKQYASQNLINKIQTGIGIFYATRILSIGFILLGLSLFYLLKKDTYRWEILILFIVLGLVSLFIYWNSRTASKLRKEAVKFLKKENSNEK